MGNSLRFERLSGLLLALALCAGSVLEIYGGRGRLSIWLGRFSLSYWLVLIGCMGVLLIFLAIVIIPTLDDAASLKIKNGLIQFRAKYRRVCWIAIVLPAALSAYLLLFTPFGEIFNGFFIRTVIWLTIGLLTAYFATHDPERLLSLPALGFAFSFSAVLLYLAAKAATVTNYPFMLIWSEGNRFYDYSILLGGSRYLYSGELSIPYGDPGRYLLWGLPFLIHDTPIWFHRLWDALLWTVPYLIFGWLLARLSRLKNLSGWTFAFWIALFLAQGPVYPTLILAAVIVIAFVKSGNWWSTYIGGIAGGYYAALSRFTWLPAAATWTGFLLISDFKLEHGSTLRRTFGRLIPIGFAVLTALAASAAANSSLINPSVYTSEDSLSFSQPLLWHRLLPNSTFPPGILLALALAAGPVSILQVWAVLSKKWSLNWIQILSYSVPCVLFLAGGLAASVKIGGGSNLHNLDLLFVSLAILTGLAIKIKPAISARNLTKPIQGLILLAFLFPCWNIALSVSPNNLPDADVVEFALESAHAKAIKAQERGEVLFIDHRQLMTFGYIRGVDLLPEYEKKYMMDQAMAGNEKYFADFYKDLANQRFSLIIAQPIFTSQQENTDNSFPEENNAWVKWVAEPLLCYYAPSETLPEVQIQFLVPRSKPQECP